MMTKPGEPSVWERGLARIARTLIQTTLGNILGSWGPMDLKIAITLDVDLLKDALAFAPREMAVGKSMAGAAPRADRQMLGSTLYYWMEKNYPGLFRDPVLGDILASPEGKAWFMKNVEAFRQYFWGT